ncbi:hypothetical protein FB451DRAFT_1402769 [Mycena latifolia]|nr:hypothetical protein FB451DRAFT_1402769 [Mycena latifolia]
MAYEHLHAADPTLDPVQVGDIVQGIITHTLTFDCRKSSAIATLLKICAGFDGLGYDVFGFIVATCIHHTPRRILTHSQMADIIPRVVAVQFLVPPDEVCQ